MRFLLSLFVVALAIGCGRTPTEDDDCTDTTCNDASPKARIAADPNVGPARPPQSSRDASTSDGATDAGESFPMDAAGLAPCMTGGNVFHIEGDPGDIVYPGSATLGPLDGTWNGNAFADSVIQVTVNRGDSSSTDWAFALNFITSRQGIATGHFKAYDYTTAASKRAPYFTLWIDGRECGEFEATVDILAVESQSYNRELTSLVATFEQHCRGAIPALRGCVRFHK